MPIYIFCFYVLVPVVTMMIACDSDSLTDYDEETVCGLSTLILCDDICTERADIYCNLIYDCSDWYDEFNCAGESVSCDFESSDTCGYVLENRGDHEYSWVYNAGGTGTPDTGPLSDHTFMNDSGTITLYWMYFLFSYLLELHTICLRLVHLI